MTGMGTPISHNKRPLPIASSLLDFDFVDKALSPCERRKVNVSPWQDGGENDVRSHGGDRKEGSGTGKQNNHGGLHTDRETGQAAALIP